MKSIRLASVLGLCLGLSACGNGQEPGLEGPFEDEEVARMALSGALPGVKAPSFIGMTVPKVGPAFAQGVFYTQSSRDLSAQQVKDKLLAGEWADVLYLLNLPSDTCRNLPLPPPPPGSATTQSSVGPMFELVPQDPSGPGFTLEEVGAGASVFYAATGLVPSDQIQTGAEWDVQMPDEPADFDASAIDGTSLKAPGQIDLPALAQGNGTLQIDATKPLVLQWTPVPGGTAVRFRFGFSGNGAFSCLVFNDGSFTIPQSFLAGLPASGSFQASVENRRNFYNPAEERLHQNLVTTITPGSYVLTP